MCYWTLKRLYALTEVHFNRDFPGEGPLAAYKRAGRWIVRAFGPWVDINEAFRRGLAEEGVFDLEGTADIDEYAFTFNILYTDITFLL